MTRIEQKWANFGFETEELASISKNTHKIKSVKVKPILDILNFWYSIFFNQFFFIQILFHLYICALHSVRWKSTFHIQSFKKMLENPLNENVTIIY